jgi:hypothetical protein
MGFVRVVAPEFLVMNGLHQLSGLSAMPCTRLITGRSLFRIMLSRQRSGQILGHDRCRMFLAGYCPI